MKDNEEGLVIKEGREVSIDKRTTVYLIKTD